MNNYLKFTCFSLVCFIGTAFVGAETMSPRDTIKEEQEIGGFVENVFTIKKNGLFGVLHPDGTVLIKPRYHAIENFDVYRPGWAMVRYYGNYGFINSQGVEVVSTKYNKIFHFGVDFEGLAKVQVNDLINYIDMNGREVFPRFLYSVRKSGTPDLLIVEERNGEGLFNVQTRDMVLIPRYNRIFPFGDIHPEWAMVEREYLKGFVNPQGELVVTPKYSEIMQFDDFKTGWLLVKEGNKYGLLNTDGGEILPPIYDKIYPFDLHQEGFAKVVGKESAGMIDQEGVFYPNLFAGYDEVYEDNQLNRKGWVLVSSGNLYGVTDKEGNPIIEPKYNKIYPFDIHREGLAMVEIDGLKGFINTDGVEVVKPVYEDIQ